MPVKSLSVIWVREEDYPRFREICGPSVHDTYAEWKDAVERKLEKLSAQGVHLERVVIDVEEFHKWAIANFGEVNSEARAAYAAYLAMNRDSAVNQN